MQHQDGRRRPDGRHDGQDGQHHRRRAPSQSVDTGALADDLFAPPAGYKIKRARNSALVFLPLAAAARARRVSIAVELRPPRAELEAAEGMDAWIDTYHAIRSLTRHDVRVMVTDSAVGAQEENNLRHLVANLGDAVGRATTSSRFSRPSTRSSSASPTPIRRCTHGFPSLVVLGGDKHVGRPRCVEHAWQLRQRDSRAASRVSSSAAGPTPPRTRCARWSSCCSRTRNADFYLTQIVSHHQADRVKAFLEAGRATRPDAAGRVRRVLLPQRQPEDAADAEPVPAGAG